MYTIEVVLMGDLKINVDSEKYKKEFEKAIEKIVRVFGTLPVVDDWIYIDPINEEFNNGHIFSRNFYPNTSIIQYEIG